MIRVKDIMARCPFNSSIVCNGIKNSSCDDKCVNHPLCEGNQTHQGSYCPFNDEVMCNGENCDNECYYHPDWEFVDDDDEDESEYEEVFNEAWNLGFKKGYLARIEEEDEEPFEEDWCECRALGYSQGLDQGYVDGYREALLGIPCFIKNEEIELLQKLKKR